MNNEIKWIDGTQSNNERYEEQDLILKKIQKNQMSEKLKELQDSQMMDGWKEGGNRGIGKKECEKQRK